MSFGALAAGWVLAGLGLLAGLLYLLQRLRVRHRELPVVTTLFWHAAVREERVRVLTGRFRHPLAYLLALSIAALLWVAVADPRLGGSAAGDVAILIDGSAAMARGDRFDRAVADALAAARSGPRGRTRVILCAGRPRTLLAPHEDVLVLAERLDGVAPQACPAGVAATIEELVDARRDGAPLLVQVAGDAPVPSELLELLPAQVTVVRLTQPAAQPSANRGITALGVTEPVSGRWGVVDVLVTTAGTTARTAPQVTLDGRVWDGAPEVRAIEREATFTYADVPARGGRLEVALPGGDALGLDDVAAAQLPDRPPIRVRVHPDAPAALRAVLQSDPAVSLVDSDAVVEVRHAATPGTGAPALLVVPADAQAEAVQVLHDPRQDPRRVLRQAVRGLGLSRIDAPELAQAVGRPIALGAVPSPTRGVAVWDVLLDEPAGFVHTRAFPLFVLRSVRWLAGASDVVPTAGAGRLLPADSAWTTPDGARLEGAGSPFPAPRAGDYHDVDQRGRTLVVALLDPAITSAPAAGPDALPVHSATDGGVDLVSVLGLLALALLGVEWVLYRTGRMP